MSWELKAAGLDWRSCLLERWELSGKRLLVARLMADPAFRTAEDRVRAFIERVGGCRTTYFNHARRLRNETTVTRIVLVNTSPSLSARQTEVSLLNLLRE